MSDQGGARYTRSFSGLVGAMVVIVVLVVGLVVLRNVVFGGQGQERRPVAVDYLTLVRSLQLSDFDPVYPETVPDGWIVTEVGADPGTEPSYRLNFYTPDDEFVGIRQEPREVDAMLTDYVDEDTVSEDPLQGVGDVAETWEGWSDTSGDYAYSTVLNGESVLVFGDVTEAELADLVGRLGTTEIATG